MTKIDMIEATRLTREGRLDEAMTLLRGGAAPGYAGHAKWAGPNVTTLDLSPAANGVWVDAGDIPRAARRGTARQGPAMQRPVPAGARFEEHAFANEAGSRAYMLYVPSVYRRDAQGLVVMLHGCTQTPIDFAAGTRMNEIAESANMLVAYPAQPQSANVSKCWNWFSRADQQRDRGEPSLVAGLTREVLRNFAVEPGRVYVAGLSAGGAAAAILGETYADLFAAVGVHSGLACGAASDLPSALTAMRLGSPGTGGKSDRPTIVFHGDRDTTVHPVNGEQVSAQANQGSRLRTEVTRGVAEGGLPFTRTIHRDPSGRAMHEHWLLHGAGHAWSGGDPSGSYTEPRGPDASREMMRFFLEHRTERDT